MIFSIIDLDNWKNSFAVLQKLGIPVVIAFNEKIRLIKNKGFLSIHIIQCD